VILADASDAQLSISRKDVRELLRFQLRATAKQPGGIAEILGETAHLRWTEKGLSGLVVRC
jgi:hypothetical protein